MGVFITRSGNCTDGQVRSEVATAIEGLGAACDLFQRAAAGEEGSPGMDFCRKSLVGDM